MIDCHQSPADVDNGRLKRLCSNTCQINIDLGCCLIQKTVILVSIILTCKCSPVPVLSAGEKQM